MSNGFLNKPQASKVQDQYQLYYDQDQGDNSSNTQQSSNQRNLSIHKYQIGMRQTNCKQFSPNKLTQEQYQQQQISSQTKNEKQYQLKSSTNYQANINGEQQNQQHTGNNQQQIEKKYNNINHNKGNKVFYQYHRQNYKQISNLNNSQDQKKQIINDQGNIYNQNELRNNKIKNEIDKKEDNNYPNQYAREKELQKNRLYGPNILQKNETINTTNNNNIQHLTQKQKIKNLFINKNFDFLECNGGQNYLILYENIVFYCLEVINDNLNQLLIKGKLYSVNFDQNYNPTFKFQEGNFNINLEKKLFQLNGEGKEYFGKSTIIKFDGQFKNGQYCQDLPQSKQGIRAQSQAPIRKIIIREGGKIINNNLTVKKSIHPIKLWCKFNQQINERDENILHNRKWLTSSVIDSFVLYLNIESEKEYFAMDKNQRQQISKILFLPTSLTTNFGFSYDYQKAEKLFRDELLQFQEINFELKIIYKKIGFPINKNNTHWQFLLFDYEKNQVELFDSLQHQIDQNLIKTLAKLLNLESCKQIINQFSGQQNNGYACGYHVCSFMQYCQYQQFYKSISYHYDEQKIINTLLGVIKDEINLCY